MTFHVQAGVPNWLDAVQRLPAGVVVKAFEVQKGQEVKAANPGVRFWHRYWNDPYQNVNPSDTEAVREQRARGWFNMFIDGTFLQYAVHVDFISWWNEYYAQSQTPEEKELWWKQERVAARIWRDEYRSNSLLSHVRLTICAAPVGNDIPWQSAQTAVMYDAVLDYHPYDWWQNGQRHSSSWQYQSGRWAMMDNTFRSLGFKCDWLFGEGGPYATAIDGWRHPNVCGGDAAKYAAAVKWWIDQAKQTTAYQQGRVLSPPTLFTTGGSSQWSSFETKQPEMNAIADVVKANWNAVPPPPPPPPDPEPTGNLLRNADFEGGWFDQSTGQVPYEWGFQYYTDNNPYDPNNYVKPETRVILKSQLPPGEWDQFGLTGNRAIKAFKGGGTWHGTYSQILDQPLSKPGKATIPFFADLVLSYQGGKIYATYDPNNPAGQLRVNGGNWYLMHPGAINEPTFDLPAGTTRLDVEWRCNYPLPGNNIFWDNPILEEVETMPDPCTPRTPYSRYYVVIHPSATPEQAAEVMRQYWPNRRTVGGSYDDAGHGPGLTSRTALLLGIPENEKQIYLDWYNQYYPGTIVQFGVLPLAPFPV